MEYEQKIKKGIHFIFIDITVFNNYFSIPLCPNRLRLASLWVADQPDLYVGKLEILEKSIQHHFSALLWQYHHTFPNSGNSCGGREPKIWKTIELLSDLF